MGHYNAISYKGTPTFYGKSGWKRHACSQQNNLWKLFQPCGLIQRFKLRLFKAKGMVMIMAKGTVKWFSEERGFGIIESSDNDEVFVHISEIHSNGITSLSENQEVEFEIVKGVKGLLARRVFLK